METAEQEEPRRRGGPLTFMREVRAEARKVTWATRQEVWISTVMVLIMCAMATLFFFIVDTIVSFVIRLILGIQL